jgi:glycosyltransferase involved in cell wall biosynthesis
VKHGTGNIGFLCTSKSYGGLEINTILLAKWLTGRGLNIILFVIKDSPLYEKAKDTGIEIICIDEHRKYFDSGKAKKFLAVLQNANIKILQTSDTKDLNFAALVKRFSRDKIKFVHVQHMQTRIKKKSFLHRFTFSKIDIWISPLKMLAEQTIEKTTITKNQIQIIPHCLNTGKFYKRIENAREKLNVPEDVFVYGVIGRIDKQKRQDYAIKAFSKIKNREQSVLLFVGDATKNENNNYYNELLNLSKEPGIEGRIIFRNFMEDVETAYSAIDCFILTTPTETYGMVTLEAMASRVPVIGSDSGGTVEILDNGKCGLLYKFLSVDDLAEKMEIMYYDNELRARLTENAYKRITEEFDYKIESNLYVMLYRNLI